MKSRVYAWRSSVRRTDCGVPRNPVCTTDNRAPPAVVMSTHVISLCSFSPVHCITRRWASTASSTSTSIGPASPVFRAGRSW
jgi:hypothetical protein